MILAFPTPARQRQNPAALPPCRCANCAHWGVFAPIKGVGQEKSAGLCFVRRGDLRIYTLGHNACDVTARGKALWTPIPPVLPEAA